MTAPYWSDGQITLHLGDCLAVLREMPDASVDAIVTDPPAAIGFMGKSWDADLGGRDQWIGWLAERMEQACRVLKPGGHALVWALPRTSGWTQMALEDAGFEIRDCIVHIFGSGYPKSLNVAKAIASGGGRPEDIRRMDMGDAYTPSGRGRVNYDHGAGSVMNGSTVAAPLAPEAAAWNGWGTSLKPGQEMWWLARKPLAGTVASTVLEYGTGALNIAACKVGSEQRTNNAGGSSSLQRVSRVEAGYRPTVTTSEGVTSDVTGRWPANIVFTHSARCSESRCEPDCPAGEVDRQSGASVSRIGQPRQSAIPGDGYGMTHTGAEYADRGGASRFYPVFRYQAKAPTSERPRLDDGTAHETVKPLGLMRWLTRLVTPPGGIVLDLFAGSGTTGEACIIEGFRCVLIDDEVPHAELIRARLRKPIQPDMFGGVA